MKPAHRNHGNVPGHANQCGDESQTNRCRWMHAEAQARRDDREQCRQERTVLARGIHHGKPIYMQEYPEFQHDLLAGAAKAS